MHAILAILLILAGPQITVAQSTDYTSILQANPYYYVPQVNTLAFQSSLISFGPLPVGDQTLWNFTNAYTSNNSTYFTGTATGYINTTNGSTSSISGTINSSGNVYINFISSSETNVGVGQFVNVGGVNQFLMQTHSGSAASYVNHWSYMAPTNSLNQITLQSESSVATYPTNSIWNEYSWIAGSEWQYNAASLQGLGSFAISSYNNGYFIGAGLSENTTAFEILGSVTPTGEILFNYTGPTGDYLGSLWGNIEGTTMNLVTYDSSGNPLSDGTAQLVPEPSTYALLLLSGAASLWALRRRKS
jgi:hypothetical protein